MFISLQISPGSQPRVRESEVIIPNSYNRNFPYLQHEQHSHTSWSPANPYTPTVQVEAAFTRTHIFIALSNGAGPNNREVVVGIVSRPIFGAA
jgi:hypothetical protein